MADQHRKLAQPDFGHAAASYNVRPEYLPHQIDEVIRTHNVAPDAVVADIGAGSGKLTQMFSGKCGAMYCVELSPQMLEKGRAALKDFKGEVHYIVADYRETKVPDGKADLLVIGDAAHWFGDEIAAVKEFRRISTPEAKIAIFSRQPDSNAPIVQKLHELLMANDPVYSQPDSNWVVKNDKDLDRKQGDHLVAPGATKISEQMIMQWTRDDLVDYLMSRSSGKWVQDNKDEAKRLIIEPLFQEFAGGGERIQFPYQSGVLVGRIKVNEVVHPGGDLKGAQGVHNARGNTL